MKNILFVGIILTFCISCGEQRNPSVTANKIDFPETDSTISENSMVAEQNGTKVPEFKVFKVNSKTGATLTTEKGSEIAIPAYAFTFKDETPVNGSVDVMFREFQSPGEIIASNIPMVWDSSGHKIQFESAGMFEIRAFQNNQELKIAKGKKIKVDLASRIKGVFSFFNLKDDRSNWTLISQNHREKPNDKKGEKINRILKDLADLKKPLPPRELKATDTVFDLEINPATFPQFADLNGVMWQYAGTDPSQNPLNNTDFNKYQWQTADLTPLLVDEEPVYKILVSRTDSRKKTNTIEFLARPLFKGARLTKENKIFKNNFEEYQRKIAALQTEQKATQMELAFLRSEGIEQLGIYNYDRKYSDENNFQLVASFDFGKQVNLNEFPVRVYLISLQENVIIKYLPDTYEKFAFNPLVKNKLVALLPSNEVVCFSSDDFKRIPLSKLRRGDKFTFKLKPAKSNGQSAEKLDETISAL